MIDKLTELDNSILEARKIQSSIIEFKDTIASLESSIVSKIESISKSSSSKNSDSKKEDSKLTEKSPNSSFPGLDRRSTPNTFTIGEWLDKENRDRKK